MKTIGYVTPYNPFTNRVAFSGVIYKVREAIEKAGVDVVWIPYRNDVKKNIGIKILNKFYKMIGQARFSGGICEKDLKKWASTIDTSKIEKCDALFFPTNTQIALYCNFDKPIINFSDATVQQMVGYYWNGYGKKTIEEASNLETKATQISSLLIRPSQWAIDSLIKDCGADTRKCHLLEYGPCIDLSEITPVKLWKEGRLNILFSGVDWKRKGGEIAVKTTRLLRENGIDAHLYVVGPKVQPSDCQGLEYVTFVGFLDKNNPSNYTQYIELFKRSHIFLLPTLAECAGIVFAEASAFGLPCYTYSTGGVTNYVVNGVNGRTLPLGSSADMFCRQILNDIKTSNIENFHDGGLELCKTTLSWDVWARKFAEIIDK